MAQFDSLIILPLIFSLLIILFFYYKISIKMVIPDFFTVKKFRQKKLNSFYFFVLFKKTKIVSLIDSYKSVFNPSTKQL